MPVAVAAVAIDLGRDLVQLQYQPQEQAEPEELHLAQVAGLAHQVDPMVVAVVVPPQAQLVPAVAVVDRVTVQPRVQQPPLQVALVATVDQVWP